MECVETLREWILQEAEFQTVAAETLCGLTGKRRDSSHTFFARTSGSGKPAGTNCPLCKGDHPVWSCLEFKKMDVQSRRQKAKQLRLCYRCLGRNHKGGQCAQNSRCDIDGCQKTHNRVMHGDQFVNGGNVSESQVIEPKKSLSLDMGASENNAHSSGRDGERCSRPEHSLRSVNFPNLGPWPIIDMLIGIDYAEQHFSIRDVPGQPGEPVARLTPLGWTCIGSPKLTGDSVQQTNFNMTYFVHQQEKELSSALQKFWEVDSSGSIVEREVLKKEEVLAIKVFESSVQFKAERYEVEMPWKPNAPELPNTYEMAVNRLISTEKRLLKDPQLAKSYSEFISKYTH